MAQDSPETLAKGVEDLIARLRDEGVAAGEAEAEALMAAARKEAEALRQAAKTEAAQLRETARKDAEAYRAAGEAALKSAMRDAVLDMKATLTARFGEDVQRLVSDHTADPEMLKRMVLELVGRAELPEGAAEVVLPEKAVGLEALREDPSAVQSGPLSAEVLGLTADLLREGVVFGASEQFQGGIQIRVAEGDLVYDLSDQAVAALLLQHLQPRFRAILEGIVK